MALRADGDIYVVWAALHPLISKSSPLNPLSPALPSIYAKDLAWHWWSSISAKLLPSWRSAGTTCQAQFRGAVDTGRGGGGWFLLSEAIWVSHLQQGCGCNTLVLAAHSERFLTTGPDDGQEAPKISGMTCRPTNNSMPLKMMSLVTQWSLRRDLKTTAFM